MKIEEIVKQKYLTEKPEDSGQCPFCGGEVVLVEGECASSHYQQGCTCQICDASSTRHYTRPNLINKSSFVWYTIKRKALIGIQSCWHENYIYNCNKCNGAIYRTYNKDIEVMICQHCGHGGPIEL
jgi:hypothetical protein